MYWLTDFFAPANDKTVSRVLRFCTKCVCASSKRAKNSRKSQNWGWGWSWLRTIIISSGWLSPRERRHRGNSCLLRNCCFCCCWPDLISLSQRASSESPSQQTVLTDCTKQQQQRLSHCLFLSDKNKWTGIPNLHLHHHHHHNLGNQLWFHRWTSVCAICTLITLLTMVA